MCICYERSFSLRVLAFLKASFFGIVVGLGLAPAVLASSVVENTDVKLGAEKSHGPLAAKRKAAKPVAPKEKNKNWLGIPLRLHTGVNLRTDLGVHPIRFDAGIQLGRLDVVAVVDPLFAMDGQFSFDLLTAWRFDFGVAPILGWRMTAIGLQGGPQLQQNLVLGIGMELPQFFDGLLQGQFGIEMAAVLLKHGGGLPESMISFGSARDYLDLLNFGMFARFEFSVGL